MNKRSYTLGGRAARQLRRQLTSRPLTAPQRIDYRTAPTLIMVKIEAHEGAGVYRAQEVFWSGSAWATITNISRQFGVLYGTAGVRHIAAATDTAVNTIVRAFAFSVNSATGLTDWFFQEGGGGGAYTGPFACTVAPITQNFIVGAGRSASNPDYCIVHPTVFTFTASQTLAQYGPGVLYYAINREATVTVTLYWGASLPVQTAQVMYVPLCFNIGVPGAPVLRQLQYGNILIDKTVSDYCP